MNFKSSFVRGMCMVLLVVTLSAQNKNVIRGKNEK